MSLAYAYVGGIKNLANTCYMGSSLQILYRYKPFVDFLEKNQNIPEIKILYDVSESIRTQYITDPSPIIDVMKINYTEQHDLTEFFAKFVDFISRCYKQPEPNDFTMLFTNSLFISQEIPLDTFIFMTLPVIEDLDLQQLVHIQLESRKSKFHTKSSDLFLIQLNRMTYDRNTCSFQKNCGFVTIPKELDLSAFGGEKYQLYAVSTHIGTGFKGHYITSVHDDAGWIEINDDIIMEQTEEEAFNKFNEDNRNAYVIAYVTNKNNIITYRDKVEMHLSQVVPIEIPSQNQNPYNLYIKIFDSSTMSIKEEQQSMQTKESAIEIINSYSENYDVQFSIDNKHLSEDIPHEFLDNFSTLYLYCQSKQRIYLNDVFFTQPCEYEFTIYQTPVKFQGMFHPNQKTNDMHKFAENVLFNYLNLRKQQITLLIVNDLYGKSLFYNVPDNIPIKNFRHLVKSNSITIAFSELLCPKIEPFQVKILEKYSVLTDLKEIEFDFKEIKGLTGSDIIDKRFGIRYSQSMNFYYPSKKYNLIQCSDKTAEELYMLYVSHPIYIGSIIPGKAFECFEYDGRYVHLLDIKQDDTLGVINNRLNTELKMTFALFFSINRSDLIDDPDFTDFFSHPNGCFVYSVVSKFI